MKVSNTTVFKRNAREDKKLLQNLKKKYFTLCCLDSFDFFLLNLIFFF